VIGPSVTSIGTLAVIWRRRRAAQPGTAVAPYVDICNKRLGIPLGGGARLVRRPETGAARIVSGSRSMARSSALAGASGVLRRCSQSRRVATGNPNASANSTCVIPSRCRNAFTGETRRILALDRDSPSSSALTAHGRGGHCSCFRRNTCTWDL
jgi:hypothetical protein